MAGAAVGSSGAALAVQITYVQAEIRPEARHALRRELGGPCAGDLPYPVMVEEDLQHRSADGAAKMRLLVGPVGAETDEPPWPGFHGGDVDALGRQPNSAVPL